MTSRLSLLLAAAALLCVSTLGLAACSDTTDDGLINFDKKRREFEILAQIRLLQSAAQMYSIRPDRGFFEWFYNIRVYDDKESYELSCDIEPYVPATPKDTQKGHKKRPRYVTVVSQQLFHS